MGPTPTDTRPPRTHRRPGILHRGTRRCRRRHHPRPRHRWDFRGSHRHRESPWGRMASHRWDPRTRKVHGCAFHSTMRSRGFTCSLRLCL